jgi:hypothetical protein
VRVVGSMEGRRARCWRTCSKYAKEEDSFLIIVHILIPQQKINFSSKEKRA